MSRREAMDVCLEYQQTSQVLLDELSRGNLADVECLLERRAEIAGELEAALVDAGRPRELLPPLRRIVEIDRAIETGLREARDVVSEQLHTLRTYDEREDRSFEARAYDQRG